MPAQILPAMDTSHDYLVSQKMAQDQQNEDRRYGLQQQELMLQRGKFMADQQHEQVLAPLRQKMLEMELQKGAQGLQAGLAGMAQAKELHESQVSENKARTGMLDQQTTNLQTENSQMTDPQSLRNREIAAKLSEADAATEMHKEMTKAQQTRSVDEHNKTTSELVSEGLRQKGLAVENDERSLKYQTQITATVNAAASLPIPERKHLLDSLLQSGAIDKPVYDHAISAPEAGAARRELYARELGESDAVRYDYDLKRINNHEATIKVIPADVVAGTPERVVSLDPGQEAMKDLIALQHKYERVLQTKNDFSQAEAKPIFREKDKDGQLTFLEAEDGLIYKAIDPATKKPVYAKWNGEKNTWEAP